MSRPPPPARLLWLGPAAAYAALIFWLSHQQYPAPWMPRAWWTWDKLLHAVEYAGLAALLVLGLSRIGRVGPRGAVVLAALLAAAYGATDELHQAFVPGRDASWLDWTADAAGAIAGGILAVPFLRRRGGAG